MTPGAIVLWQQDTVAVQEPWSTFGNCARQDLLRSLRHSRKGTQGIAKVCSKQMQAASTVLGSRAVVLSTCRAVTSRAAEVESVPFGGSLLTNSEALPFQTLLVTFFSEQVWKFK